MEAVTRPDLSYLISKHDTVCVSIYMTAHPAGLDSKQNPVRFKDLLYRAERTISERNPKLDAHGVLQPVFDLLPDGSFWLHQVGGLALFLAPGFLKWYRLPESFEDKVVVGQAFHLKPLIPLIATVVRFYVVAVSKNEARILRGGRYGIDELDVESIPRSLADALRYDDLLQKQIQFYWLEAGGARKNPQTMSHGHGIGAESGKTNILRYFQQIDRGLREILDGEEVPLVFAGVGYLFPLYQQANTYPHLVPQAISGNADRLETRELHKRALELVMPHVLTPQRNALARFHEAHSQKSRIAETDLTRIVMDSYYGRVRTLFTAAGAQRWGTFDASSERVEIHDSQDQGGWDLVDFSAVHTYLNRGTVYNIEAERMPAPGIMAAELRY